MTLPMTLPRLPAELWPLILDYVDGSLDKIKQIELMLRVGSKHAISVKNCKDVLENGYLKYVNDITSNFLYNLEYKLKDQLPINIYKQILEISFNNIYIIFEIVYYLYNYYLHNDIQVIIKPSYGHIYKVEILLKSDNYNISFRYESLNYHRFINETDVNSCIIRITEEGWKTKGIFHRNDGPAITMWWFDKEEYIGKPKNYTLLRMSWYSNGSYHRTDGPARLGWRLPKNGSRLHFEEWYQDNELYRTNGLPKIWYHTDGTINESISGYIRYNPKDYIYNILDYA